MTHTSQIGKLRLRGAKQYSGAGTAEGRPGGRRAQSRCRWLSQGPKERVAGEESGKGAVTGEVTGCGFERAPHPHPTPGGAPQASTFRSGGGRREQSFAFQRAGQCGTYCGSLGISAQHHYSTLGYLSWRALGGGRGRWRVTW